MIERQRSINNSYGRQQKWINKWKKSPSSNNVVIFIIYIVRKIKYNCVETKMRSWCPLRFSLFDKPRHANMLPSLEVACILCTYVFILKIIIGRKIFLLRLFRSTSLLPKKRLNMSPVEFYFGRPIYYKCFEFRKFSLISISTETIQPYFALASVHYHILFIPELAYDLIISSIEKKVCVALLRCKTPVVSKFAHFLFIHQMSRYLYPSEL